MCFCELVVAVVCVELEVQAVNDGEAESEFEVQALEPRDGLEPDLQLGHDDIEAFMIFPAVPSDKGRVPPFGV